MTTPKISTSNRHKKFLSTLIKWYRNAKTRHHLEDLPDYLLDDIGVSRQDAKQEINKPFWK
ncbi:DUF1127 domain-containing protein [Vibrio viridaestus]|uniref:DUF1127 domain-containing protein n=2 Tax=Vibrio viridaestus TaxID=2487322 RepID=A0A3N9TKR0_9VIBR|nr:DUF1127 domain-containing protein [Vibrio viridaestus]RQW64443.1 DUF1127 domain-containing protein [Vibrio viridaestus]